MYDRGEAGPNNSGSSGPGRTDPEGIRTRALSQQTHLDVLSSGHSLAARQGGGGSRVGVIKGDACAGNHQALAHDGISHVLGH